MVIKGTLRLYTLVKNKNKINGVVGSMMEGLGVYLKMSRLLKKGKIISHFLENCYGNPRHKEKKAKIDLILNT